MQVCKYASMQVCKYASMQVCKYASMQVCMYECMHVCMYASMQVCRYAGMQVCRYAGMQVCKYASMQVCKPVKIPERRLGYRKFLLPQVPDGWFFNQWKVFDCSPAIISTKLANFDSFFRKDMWNYNSRVKTNKKN